MRNEHVLKTEKICRTFFSIQSLSNIAVIGNFDFNNFFNVLILMLMHNGTYPNSASGSALASQGKGLEIESHAPDFFSSAYGIFSSREPEQAPERASVNKQRC